LKEAVFARNYITESVMQVKVLVYLTCLAHISCAATAIEIPSFGVKRLPFLNRQSHPQSPMNMPSSNGDSVSGGGPVHGDLTISDVLPKERRINIFASLTRDVASVTARLELAGGDANTTLLAPLNSAMQALPRKPWEDPPDDTSGISAARNEDKAAENLRRFVEAHVVAVSPWREGRKGKTRTMGGGEVWWETRDGKRVVMPSEVEVDAVAGRVGNGEVWVLRGVVNYV